MKKSVKTSVMAMAFLGLLFQSCKDHPQKIELRDTTEQNKALPEQSNGATVTIENKKLDPNGKTAKDLQDGYKGERTAIAKYQAYSKKAGEEGYHNIALLFKAVSMAETVHAGNHQTIMEMEGIKVPEVNPKYPLKDTKENLKNAIGGESYEAKSMYPGFIKDANAEGNYMAQMSFTYAYNVEKKHRDYYKAALADLETDHLNSLAKVYYICPVCGNTYADKAPERCEITLAKADTFTKVDKL
jgi:rubrerythrin